MRTMLRAGAVAAAAAALVLAVATGWRPAGEQPVLCPGCNIILISLDTLRADHVGAYGYPRPTTPNIDLLAARSLLFENAVSQSAWTRPAHASMFTGLYPSEHGILSVSQRVPLDPGLPTLASELRGLGYATAAFTGGANLSARFGFDSGFELYRDSGRRIEDNLGPALAWLEKQAGRRFFLFLHGYDPHRPYRSTPRDRRALGLGPERSEGILDACRTQDSAAAMEPFIREYDAAIRRGDRSLGTFIDGVAGLGLLDNTVVVFTSDHGEEFLEHGRCFHIRSLYGEVLKVPLIFYVPGLEPSRVDALVPASVSVAPTLLELVSPAGTAMAGHSLLPYFHGRGEPMEVVSETSSRYVNGHGQGRLRSLTRSNEKLIQWLSIGRSQYFDLDTDPGETRALDGAPRAALLERRLETWARRHTLAASTDRPVSLPRALRKRLEAMGYLQ